MNKNRTILKYCMTEVVSTFVMPAGAHIRHIAQQYDRICIWAEVDREVEKTWLRTFCLVGTGLDIPEGAWYHGTVIAEGGALVLHVYELPGGGRLDDESSRRDAVQ